MAGLAGAGAQRESSQPTGYQGRLRDLDEATPTAPNQRWHGPQGRKNGSGIRRRVLPIDAAPPASAPALAGHPFGEAKAAVHRGTPSRSQVKRQAPKFQVVAQRERHGNRTNRRQTAGTGARPFVCGQKKTGSWCRRLRFWDFCRWQVLRRHTVEPQRRWTERHHLHPQPRHRRSIKCRAQRFGAGLGHKLKVDLFIATVGKNDPPRLDP